jgi:hypothetical protein
MNEDFFHSLYGMMIVHQYEFECFLPCGLCEPYT